MDRRRNYSRHSSACPVRRCSLSRAGARPRCRRGTRGQAMTIVAEPARRRWTRNRLLFIVVAWLIVLMPFLFWRATWFGRPLSDQAITTHLRDDQHPRNIQHALVQIGERMSRRQDSTRWYPELVRLAGHPAEEI